MHYEHMVAGHFLDRPNRFIAHVEIDGKVETVHVKNTGRCRELLPKGAEVYCQRSGNPARKTQYDLIAVRKGARLINMDSQVPNDAAAEWLPRSGLFSEQAVIRREVTYGDSRFDVYVEDGERKAFLEVKGVTLEQDGVAMFPDAPTERGVKHLHELCKAVDDGYECYLLLVIQMKDIHLFRPNTATHPAFAKALQTAAARGVHILAMDCVVTPDSMVIDKPVAVELG